MTNSALGSLICYASQSGQPTLDEGEGGGNPFASALIELLGRASLSATELCTGLVELTAEKSGGFQISDVPSTASHWIIRPNPAEAKRMALVFAYSDYRQAQVNSLPGAATDVQRVGDAFRRAGFTVETLVDPGMHALKASLQSLSVQSAHAEAAAIYATGHGVEHNGTVYLLPNDYPFSEPATVCEERAISVSSLSHSLNAREANFIFFGGCRTYW